MKTFVAAAATSLAFAGHASAFWRMPCRSQTGIGRVDPLVDPGSVSDHVHTIMGGGGFGPNANFSTLQAEGSCTSCEVTQDHSAYWTPTVHFMYTNGTTVMVPQVGGMLAYYLYYLDNVTAFPEGFAMIAGNPAYRNFSGPVPDTPLSFWPTDPTDQFFLEQRALGFNCLNYAKTPEASLYRHTFPDKNLMDNECLDGLRLELAFPSCGNGELTSDDYRSHVAYPSLVKEGNCPDGFDVHYPFLFFETIWATNEFIGEDGDFVLSTGDPVGTSYHGDFIMGWESADFLQEALDTCTSPSGEIQDCPLFDIQKDSVGAQCTFDLPSELKNDDCHGPRDGLPVDVPVQYGPEPATKYPVAGKDSAPTTSLSHTARPATFTQSAASYSPVDAASTSTALGGIVVALASDALNKAHPTAAGESYSKAISQVTSAPASSSPTSESISSSAPISDSVSTGKSVSTTTMTQGSSVIEMVIEEMQVTVTATAAATPYAKRHLQHHQHHHHAW